LADAGCSVAATLDSVAVPERSLALKVPEPLQKQLFTVREEMARAVWGAPVETVGLADWRHARQVFFEAARLRTRRRPEDYRKYTVQMVARLSGGKDPRVTETRFVVCPETAAEDVAKALARRFIPSGATV
jgi:hypothetical protein